MKLASMWQERAPQGPWFVETEHDGHIFFGNDTDSAKQCMDAINRHAQRAPVSQEALDWAAGEVGKIEDYKAANPDWEKQTRPAREVIAQCALWQPIETAPKDGTWILTIEMRVTCAPDWIDPIPETLRWFEDQWDNGLCDQKYWPSHWMPLPRLPALTSTPGQAIEKTDGGAS